MRQLSAFPWVRAAILGGLCLQLGSTTAMASGFSIPEASALGTAMSNAVVANPEETGRSPTTPPPWDSTTAQASPWDPLHRAKLQCRHGYGTP